MKKHLLLLGFTICFLHSLKPTTSLAQISAGDIAFVQFNTDGSVDEFAFVVLEDIPGSAQIYFSENEPTSTTAMNTGEGYYVWTAPGAGVTCGTVVTINSTPTTSHGTVTEPTQVFLSTSGDGIWAFQGTSNTAVTNWVAAIGFDGGTGLTTGNEGSVANTTLTIGTNAVGISEVDNGKYDGTLLSGTKAALLAAINNPSNWITNNSSNQTFSGTFTVTDCAPPPPSNCSGQMAGTYTINPSAAASCTNYQDFASALSDMINGTRSDDNDYRHDGGISGAVAFDVAAGTYTGQMSIAEIPGASATNTITFRSASGNNADVTITHASSGTFSDPNYTIQLNGADHIRFEDMTIERTGTSTYARVIDFSGDASNNVFDGNIITGRATGSTSNDGTAVIFTEETNSGIADNTFSNNEILYGFAGIVWESNSANSKPGLTVTGNTFSNYRYGLLIDYATDLVISGNTITNNPSNFNSAQLKGVECFRCEDDLTITGNTITMTSGSANYGLDLQACVGSGSEVGDISNNMIIVGGTSTSQGINSGSLTSYKNYYYNSVYTTGTNASSASAFYVNGSSNINVVNNAFVASVGIALDYITESAILSSDYNLVYTGGANVAQWFSDQATLADFQAASSLDANSVSADPNFVSGTDLHVNPGSPTDAAATVLSITTDIDGEARDGSTPDIGADEFNNTLPIVTLSASSNSGEEATTTVITLTATASVAVTGNQTIDVTIGGTGITAGDYTLSNATITIPNGQTTGSITFTIVDDSDDEGDETAEVVISNPSPGGYVIGATDQQDILIEDDDAAPICGSEEFDGAGNSGSYATNTWTSSGVNWQATDSRGDQDLNGSEAVTLRNGSLTNTASVAGGCGTLSFDYARVFSNNSTLRVYVNGTQYGGDISVTSTTSTTFSVVVNQAGNIDIELENSGNRTVIDKLTWTCYTPAFPPVELSADLSAGTEDAATVVTLTATAAFAVTGDQTVDLTVTGTGITAGDYTLGAASITILDGQTTGTTTFTVVDDAVTESTETATVIIDNPSAGVTIGATDAVDIDITDNDAPVITTSVGSLSGFSTVVGTPSAEQTFTISGDNLTGNIFLGSVGGFQYSFDNSTYLSTLNIPVSGGDVIGEPLTIYVRLTGASVGSFSGNATVSGGGASSVDVVLDGTVTPAPCQELFISEYHEDGGEKYIEIYNPTSSSINLSTYELRLYTNGSTSPSSDGLSGSIPAYSTLVYRNSGSSAYGGSSTTSSAVNFNGDDAFALAKSGTNIDVIGTIGNSSTFAADVVLRRNATIQSPNTSYTSGEWTSGSTVDVTDLGQHTSDCFVPNPEATLDINITTGTEVGTTQIILTVSTDVVVTGSQTVDITLTGTADENDFTGANFSSPITVTIPNNDDEVTLTFNVNNDSDVEGAETATFTIGNPSSGVNIGTPSSQNLSITDDDNLTSNESVIVEQSGETPTISSLTNGNISNNSQGVQVWHFRLYDGDGTNPDADTKPTIYTGWVIRQSGGNTVPDWSEVIQDREFFVGSSTTPLGSGGLTAPTSIPSPIINASQYITVPDDGFVDIYMRITLQSSLPAGSDGQNFGFSLEAADVDVETDVLQSSQLGTFTETSDAALNEIGVTATLQFIDAPSTVSVGSNFSVTISAIDANGNIDSDNTSAITLSQTAGSGTLSGTGTQNLVNGTYTFTGLSHDTEETIQVTASGGGFSNINASINVVDEPYQLFDDFNRADNNTVGVPSSETTATYVELQTGADGSRTRVQANQLLLANCDNGASSGGNNGMEQVMFNVANRFETTYDDAAGTLAWVFNMNQNRSNPSGFGSNTYAAAVILGSTQVNVENASAEGYAVIIGNSGDPDPVKLVRFAGGLTTNGNVTDVAVSSETDDESHFSVRVEFNPCDGEWSLRVRDDGGSFADPNTGFLSSAVTATDQTHTGEDLRYFGYVWQHGVSCTETATFDNVNIPNATTVSTSAKVWNGSVSSSWNVANNWGPCPGAPTITDDVEIANVATQPIISSTVPAAECDNLLVEAGATLTITGSGEITVDGNVTNNGTVYVGNGGNFFQTENGTASHGGSGNFEVTRNGNSSAGFNGWSTPVIGGILPGSDGYRYNSLAGTNSNADDNNPDPDPGWIAHSGAMTPGRGYYAYSGGTATFTGRANNGSYAPSVTSSGQPLSSTSAPTFFNLIGNPYPSSLIADQFIADNSSRIDGALYFWSDENAGSAAFSSDDYATYSTGGSVVPLTGGGSSGVPNGSIPSCQGFFVNCDASGSINFNNGQRGGNNNQFFKAPVEQQRMWLSINNDALELFNQTLVGFSEDATDQKDWGVDAYKLRGNQAIALGSQQDGETYVIATFSEITSAGKTIPLMTYVDAAGVYTFVADSMEGFQDYNVYLQDLNDGMLYPMEQGDSHSFNMTSDDEFGRFQLWFSPSFVTGIEDLKLSGSIYSDQRGSVIVKTNQTTPFNGTLHIIDMSGRVVHAQPLTLTNGVGMSQVTSLSTGIYAVAFQSADGQLRLTGKLYMD